MISDSELYQLAIFLGSCAMLLIVVYHFLEVNSNTSSETDSVPVDTVADLVKPTGSSQTTQNIGNPGVGVGKKG
ncbi:uncharacterized protein GIQ15_00324 [Arthroderma uncinatum]|uniref:uncharacterized protein n=1 Tax=Arthroderma uncinatum TaxID=74035 RepID=UPI00144A73AD|nr:uncharacterized protein GIQ15_00324 [Arthroderma uncinatum]KAF3490807.1 hypothetical protein GIQ15_00324 [Arthroderma uncinatum]